MATSSLEGVSDEVETIVIVVAMEQEAQPFIMKHDLKENVPSPFEPGSPMKAYSGQVVARGRTVALHLIWNGRCKIHNVNHVATTAAGVSTYASIARFRPSLVISAGTAGGFGELGAHIGDVYLSTKCVFHGRRIPHSVQPSRESCRSTLEEYGFGHFRSPPLGRLAAACGVKQGVVSSSDSLDCSSTDLQLLRSEGAVVKEMEAAAVAWVCQQLSVPFFALKSVTDIVDGGRRTEQEFYANLDHASGALQQRLSAVVTCLCGTRLSDWADGSGSGSGKPTSEAVEGTVGDTPRPPAPEAARSRIAPRPEAPVYHALLPFALVGLGVGLGVGLALAMLGRRGGR